MFVARSLLWSSVFRRPTLVYGSINSSAACAPSDSERRCVIFRINSGVSRSKPYTHSGKLGGFCTARSRRACRVAGFGPGRRPQSNRSGPRLVVADWCAGGPLRAAVLRNRARAEHRGRSQRRSRRRLRPRGWRPRHVHWARSGSDLRRYTGACASPERRRFPSRCNRGRSESCRRSRR